SDVDRKLEEQIARRAEIDALRSQIDGLAIQVTDARQKLESVTALQAKVLPLATQLSTLKSQVEEVHARFLAAQQEKTAIAEQEKRLAEMLAASRGAAGDAGEQLRQVES